MHHKSASVWQIFRGEASVNLKIFYLRASRYPYKMMEQLRDLKGHRGFTSLAISRFISNVGNGISPIALAYGVLSLEGADGKDLSIVMAARFVPLLGFMLFGGVMADRFQRNRLVGGADMIGSFLAAVSAISLIAGFSSVWLLATMAALFGILNAIWWPAMSGVLPEILPKEKLQSGNAIIGLTTNIGYIVGTLSGGILVATVGSGWGLLADAISFFIAGVIVWFLPIIGKVKDASPGILQDLIVGWREFISRSWVIAMVFAFSLINMAFESMLSVLGPLNFSDPVTGPKQWSYNLAALTTGMLIGGIWVLKVKFKNPLRISMFLIAISSIWDFSLALDLPLLFTLLAGIFSGISLEVFMVTWMTSLQSHVPDESYSRVSSYDTLGSYGIAPLGIVVAGPLAMHFGVNTILFVTGLTTLIAAGLSLLVKSVRNLENP
jgi:MFS family permease